MRACSFTDVADVTLEAGGQVYRFEFSRRFGPLMLGKRGQSLETVPPKRSPFWKALHLWAAQGCRVVNGQCVYDVPPEPRLVQLVGRHYVEVPEGRDPEDVRREWFKKLNISYPGPLDKAQAIDELERMSALAEPPEQG
jgi:hypothetical protein